MTQPTSLLQRLDPRMLDPDALEQSTMQGMVAPGQDDAVRGLLGASMPYLRGQRERRAEAYTQQIGETNKLQALMQQRAQEAALQKAELDYDAGNVKEGFSPGSTNAGARLLRPDALASISTTQGLRDRGLQSKVIEAFSNAAKHQADSDSMVPLETMSAASGVPFVPNPNSLRREAIRASGKRSGSDPDAVKMQVATNGFSADGRPITSTYSGTNQDAVNRAAGVTAPHGQSNVEAPTSPALPTKSVEALNKINAGLAAAGKQPIRADLFKYNEKDGTYISPYRTSDGKTLVITRNNELVKR